MSKIVTAAVLLIGDEILSGRTQDTNLRTLAEFLAPHGVEVREARVVPDRQEVIVAAVRALSSSYDYLFTTGGIGPTHDDITADAVAAAFERNIDVRADALAILKDHYSRQLAAQPIEINETRMRMARIPDGASLILNPVSGAPGFQLENVFVMAGVPSIVRGMLQDVGRRIVGGAPVFSRTVRVPGGLEGELGAPLGELAKADPAVSLGSYPWRRNEIYGVDLVARSREAEKLEAAVAALVALARAMALSPEVDPQRPPAAG